MPARLPSILYYVSYIAQYAHLQPHSPYMLIRHSHAMSFVMRDDAGHRKAQKRQRLLNMQHPINAMWVFSGCRGTGCKGPHWEYSPWSNCTARCGGGTASRQALCMADASNASVAQMSVCGDVPMQEPLVRQCNLGPCDIYSWSVGTWEACSAPCGGVPLHGM